MNSRTAQQIRQCYLIFFLNEGEKTAFFAKKEGKRGVGEISKEMELTDFEMRFLEPILTLPMSTQFDTDSTEISKTCLPVEILKAWDRYRLNRDIKEEDPVLTKEKVLENLMSFLRHEVEGEEHRVLAETAFRSGKKRKDSHKKVQKDEPTAATLFANTSAGRICCVFCDRSHPSQDCQKLSSMNYEGRKSQVMCKKCCLVCLKPGHMAKKCHSNVKCLICERRHYALLCLDLRKDKNSYSKGKVADDEQKSTEVLLTNLPSEREIYLKTITVKLRHKGKKLCVRTLMDDGSHRSYMEKSLAAELNLTFRKGNITSRTLWQWNFSCC
ncbi:transposable element Tc1 transposase [Trichonephila clavata]|uniref:Transposable element Tc1 transposase n=1 Tax=Trichonephila clavata TaxID=2740835 RepID=A0A8X6JFB2_TRICU|nr:transposable element Tc1 transposase [Trichonephila clavata]